MTQPAATDSPVGRSHRNERPVRRLFETRRLTRLQIVGLIAGLLAVWIGVSLWNEGVGALVLVAGAVAAFVLRARQSMRPADPGVQIYEDVSLLNPSKLPAGVPSARLYLPYGLALGWFVRRGLVNDWFREQSGREVDDLLAGRLSGPELYARWHGIFCSDMLDDTGKAFARRYLWYVEPHGAYGGHVATEGRPSGGWWPHSYPSHRWFWRDLKTLQGDLSSLYLLDDTHDVADRFHALADRWWRRWRRWRWVYALWESERVNIRRRAPEKWTFPW